MLNEFFPKKTKSGWWIARRYENSTAISLVYKAASRQAAIDEIERWNEEYEAAMDDPRVAQALGY
jgi:hypothetical protein